MWMTARTTTLCSVLAAGLLGGCGTAASDTYAGMSRDEALERTLQAVHGSLPRGHGVQLISLERGRDVNDAEIWLAETRDTKTGARYCLRLRGDLFASTVVDVCEDDGQERGPAPAPTETSST